MFKEPGPPDWIVLTAAGGVAVSSRCWRGSSPCSWENTEILTLPKVGRIGGLREGWTVEGGGGGSRDHRVGTE